MHDGDRDREMDPYDHIEAWTTFLKGAPLDQSNPYRQARIVPTSVFLYQSSTAPPPCGARAGVWTSFPGTRELVNYLRYCYLPGVWSTWLCREAWDDAFDPGEVHPIVLATLFDEARRHDSPYADDIPVMQKIVGLLDEGGWDSLRKAERRLNRRWREASTWCFEMKLFDSPRAMGRHLRQHDGFCTVEHFRPSEWLRICDAAATDPEASDQVLAALAEALCM